MSAAIDWSLSADGHTIVICGRTDWSNASHRVAVREDARCLSRAFGRPIKIGRKARANLVEILEIVGTTSMLRDCDSCGTVIPSGSRCVGCTLRLGAPARP